LEPGAAYATDEAVPVLNEESEVISVLPVKVGVGVGVGVGVVTASGAMTILSACLAVSLIVSVTSTVNGKFPEVVGIPESRPFPVRFRPPGGTPLVTLHVYGPVPPVAVNVAEYGIPTESLGSAVVVVVNGVVVGPEEAVSVRLTLAVWAGEPESVA
jgi:hypothetical protein